MINETHDPALKSWVDSANSPDTEFPIQNLPLGVFRQRADVWTLPHSSGVTVYFIDQPRYYDRPALYTENGVDYVDNGERFIFFAKAAVHLARFLPWHPEVVHVHDWQTGLVPILILHQKLTDGWLRVPRLNFPSVEQIVAPFHARGFEVSVAPMWGRTPLNNYLFVFRR